VLVVGVADGAGSARLAEAGSGCAVRVAVAEVGDLLADGLPLEDEDWRDMMLQGLQGAQIALVAEAETRGCPLADLATTLIVAVATPELVAAAQVGDGAVVARLADDRFQAITRPPVQEYLNETTFLTSAEALRKAQVTVSRERLTGLALFSDGLQMLGLKMPEGEPHAPFFMPLFRFLSDVKDRTTAEEQLRRFLQSPRISDRADDDLTLVLAVLEGG
jgi:hypothetical protein